MLMDHFPVKETIVPHTNNRYSLTESLAIKDRRFGRLLEPSKGKYDMFIYGGERQVSLPWLIAFVLKPVYRGNPFIFDWTVLHVDGDETNIYPSNLVWKTPCGGQEAPEFPGYNIIPSFTRFAVNELGQIVSRKTKRFLSCREHSSGYTSVNVRSDVGGKYGSTRHRCLALAWLDYPADIDSLTVNHLDGDKKNDDLGNLEIVTYSENNLHAMREKLRDVMRPVRLFDHMTKDIVEFESLSETARFLSINSGSLHYHISQRAVLQHRYSCKYSDDETPFEEIDYSDLEEERKISEKRIVELGVVAYNPYTGEVKVCSTAGALGREIGLTKDEVRTAANSSSIYPVMGYVISWFHLPKKPRRFAADELIAYRNRKGIVKPIRVTYPDGSTKVYISLKEYSDETGIGYDWMRNRLKKKGSTFLENTGQTVGYVR